MQTNDILEVQPLAVTQDDTFHFLINEHGGQVKRVNVDNHFFSADFDGDNSENDMFVDSTNLNIYGDKSVIKSVTFETVIADNRGMPSQNYFTRSLLQNVDVSEFEKSGKLRMKTFAIIQDLDQQVVSKDLYELSEEGHMTKIISISAEADQNFTVMPVLNSPAEALFVHCKSRSQVYVFNSKKMSRTVSKLQQLID